MTKKTSNTIPAWVPALALVLFSLALYSPAVSYDFTGYDDDDYVTENPYIQRGLSLEMLSWALTTGHASNWHPITWISHASDWQFAGAKPGLHHATNIVLHAMNAALVFLLLRRCTNATGPSLAVAALFAVHPFNVESVAWVAERKNVLSMFFGLCSLIAYAEYARRPRKAPYIASAVCLALGLMSKPMLVTWPFVMLLLDYWPLGRIVPCIVPLGPFVKALKKLAWEKVPFFLLAAVSSIITYLVQARGGAMGSTDAIPFGYRLSNAIVSYADYVVMTVWPFGLAVLYPHPMQLISIWNVLLAAMALIAVTAGILAFAGKARYLVTGCFFFLGTLVPVIGILQVGSQAMADRYAYVPLLGLFIAGVWGFAGICARAKAPAKVPVALGCVVIVLLTMRTWDQLPHWRDRIALWQHTISVTDDNYIAHNNLGSALLRVKEPDRALAEFQEALRIRPNHPGALVNMGLLLLNRGRPADAAKVFENAVAVSPGHAAANLNLAVAYFQMRDIDKALRQAMLAQELMPNNPKVYNLLGALNDIVGRPDEAVRYLRKSLEIDPNYEHAQANLDRVLAKPRPER